MIGDCRSLPCIQRRAYLLELLADMEPPVQPIPATEDRNWKVCSQNYAPGKNIPVDTELGFGAVELEENCPAKDQREPEVEDGKMPNLAGKSVKAARGALDSGTSITVTDAAGDRIVLMESNWQVCAQSPSPGVALRGQPVEFTAVKFEETGP
ncbi:hypothetical protein [Streptomyces sp. NPDC088246]|uniref:PASTA domain-containing protein n=1 Tax=Streptomyces sp. NPDC088246 TaxID=3365842 RepID=UPI00380AEF88